MSIDTNELLSLPTAEKMRIVEMLWDDLGQSTAAIPLPDWVDHETLRRRDEMRNAAFGISHEETWRRIQKRTPLTTFVAIWILNIGFQVGEAASQTVPDSPIRSSAEQRLLQETAASHGVRLAFNRFGEALAVRDEKVASSLVSQETLDLYEQCRRLALDSSTVDFGELSQLEVLLVFQLRFLLSRERLSAMKANEVFEWGVKNGLVKQDVVKGITLNRVQAEDDVAFATLYKNGQPVEGERFRFLRENGQWKLDLIHVTRQVERVFEEIRRKSGKSKIEFAVFLLERTYKKPIPTAILNGPLN